MTLSNDSEGDLDVIDVENYHDNSDKIFSHSLLVMSIMRKCLDLGSKEMRNGWYNERMDGKGFLIRTYIEDTRKAFISAVKMALALMQPDMDDPAKTNINKIKDSLKEEFEKLCASEQEEFSKLPPQAQYQNKIQGIYPVKGYLNKELPYYHLFIDLEADKYREIFGELNELTARLDYFRGEDLEA